MPRYYAVGAPSPQELGSMTHWQEGASNIRQQPTQTQFPSFGTDASFASTQVGTLSAENSAVGASFGSRGVGQEVNVSPVSTRNQHARGTSGTTVASTATHIEAMSPSRARVPVGSTSPPIPSPPELQSAYSQPSYPTQVTQLPTDLLARPPYEARGFSSLTAYDPTSDYAGGIEDAPGNRYTLPNRYSRQQTLGPSAGPVEFTSTERLTRNVGAESIRSAQSRRSKYDSKTHLTSSSRPTHAFYTSTFVPKRQVRYEAHSPCCSFDSLSLPKLLDSG
jgi:hypothetical protein